MNEQTYHEVLSTIVHELLHSLLAVLTPHIRLYKQLHWTRLMSKRRSHPLCMCAEWDGSASVCGHRTMNLPIPVVGAELWAPWEPLLGHVLNICCPYFPRDEWRFEFPPNRHLIPSFKIVIPRMFFLFFLGVKPKITQPTSIVTN